MSEEIQKIAAGLLANGKATTPAQASAMAEQMVKARGNIEGADMVKCFDHGGPIIGGHGV